MPRLLSTAESERNTQSRLRWMRWCWVGFGLALFASTWKLWTPQTTFPQVPLLSLGLALPAWVDWISFGILLAALPGIAIIRESKWLRIVVGAYAGAMLLQVIVDQHRLQPWAYQFLLMAIVMATCRGRRTMFALRLLAISIYVHSAMGKFDNEFLHTLGQQFLSELLEFARVPDRYVTETSRFVMAFVFPLTELLVGVGLWFQRTRGAAVMGAIVMHSLLLLVLGPWGLNHQIAVLIWNAFFIAQAIVLFWPTRRNATDEATRELSVESRSTRMLAWVGTTAIFAACVLPVLEIWGRYDHWLAWGLYSPRNSRVVCYVDAEAAATLPAELQPHLVVSNESLSLLQIRLDRWSLKSLGCPIYPQDRFQVGVALWLAKQHNLQDSISISQHSAAARFTGARRHDRFYGTDEIEGATAQFAFNAGPRLDR